MIIEFEEEQNNNSDCPDKDCEWNNDGICTCSGTAPCIEYE